MHIGFQLLCICA